MEPSYAHMTDTEVVHAPDLIIMTNIGMHFGTFGAPDIDAIKLNYLCYQI
jgi:hypothetical protein